MILYIIIPFLVGFIGGLVIYGVRGIMNLTFKLVVAIIRIAIRIVVWSFRALGNASRRHYAYRDNFNWTITKD